MWSEGDVVVWRSLAFGHIRFAMPHIVVEQTSEQVVVKLLSKAISHKSDIGGVVLNIADAEAATLRQRADAAEHLGQLGPRHHAVLHVVVRRHAAHRGECRLAAFPDPLPLRLILGHLHRQRAALLA